MRIHIKYEIRSFTNGVKTKRPSRINFLNFELENKVIAIVKEQLQIINKYNNSINLI